MGQDTNGPALAAYAKPQLERSLWDIATSVVIYLALWVGMYFALEVSLWLTLALAIPAGAFLLRTFIVFHDCAHGSFLPSKRANRWCGRFCSLLVWQPFANWRHDHAVHHGSAGDLDRRGTGDVPTLTVSEYFAMPWHKRLGYRLFRNPLVMFGIGPIYSLMVMPRLTSRDKRPRLRNSVLLTNLMIAGVVVGLGFALGWKEYLLIQMPAAIMAATAGVWLFYVQHQFEDVYWESSDQWSYDDAALQGSSYLKLPKVLQFFTGNIGLHHVHHLNARVPNYNLQRAHDENPVFHNVPVLSLLDGIRSIRLKLIDTQNGRLVTFAQARQLAARGVAQPA
ncbi:MAG: fatty acid desaturase [Solirubrobacterales bacterium]|nr:fatty acid desaturase [Solirubrobacterales bacterium]